jgi:hypothetical protein
MDYSSQPFVMEHIIPVTEDGDTTLENLALACGGCNGHKYNKVEALDPASKKQASLYLKIIGITTTGRATVDALKLNRPGVVNLRKLMLMEGSHPPKEEDGS